MIRQKINGLTILLILAVSLLLSFLSAALLNAYYEKTQFELINSFCGAVIETQPKSEQAILELLKNDEWMTISEKEDVLREFGYSPSDFSRDRSTISGIIGIAALFGGLLFLLAFRYWNKKTVSRIKMLTDNLEKINAGNQGTLWEASEDEFSKLQDEMYKTVTVLYQTRDEALDAKANFADNLSNIAHQLKTPITAISLYMQMMNDNSPSKYLPQVKMQLSRLTHLEEALLLLSRIDAGTLSLKRDPVDVLTLLMLATDNLHELFEQAGVTVDIPEMSEATINVDLDWTMEATMNLFKNSMEHSPVGGIVHCSYEKNPLYVRIRIWDEGTGFEKEDLSHLFERFYRGKTAKKDSIGIGLSIAREIIERQNGILSAYNLTAGGACFEIRFYSH